MEGLTEEEILPYNSFRNKRGWWSNKSETLIQESIESYCVGPKPELVKDFGIIERDERS